MQVKHSKRKLPVLSLIFAILTLIGGFGILFLPSDIVEMIVEFAIIALLVIYGILRLVTCLQDGRTAVGIITFAVLLLAAYALIMVEVFFAELTFIPSIIVGSVSVLIGLIRLLICVNCAVNRVKGAVRNGISSFFCLVFGIAMIVHPVRNFSLLGLVCGFYLIFYSVTMFGDFFAAVLHTDMKEDRSRRRTHFAVPNLITAIQPGRMIKKINKAKAEGQLTGGMLIQQMDDGADKTANLEIMIHLTTQGANKFGHVDLAVGDKIYSYGTYDSSTVKFGGFVSQGMFIIVPKIPYLKYCLDYQQKYVIGFGAHLSDKQLSVVHDNIKKFLDNCEPFDSLYERAVKNGEDVSSFSDPASNLVRDVGGKVYTVTKGLFRRYFGININCVRAADLLLTDTGIDRLSFSGISTPGGYYTMLDNMFKRRNTRIFRKTFYIDADEIDDLEDLRALAKETAAEIEELRRGTAKQSDPDENEEKDETADLRGSTDEEV